MSTSIDACTWSLVRRTMAREKLSVVIILLANQAYGIFGTELDRLGLNDRSAQHTQHNHPFVLSQQPVCVLTRVHLMHLRGDLYPLTHQLCSVGSTTESMVELDSPHLNFAKMAEGHGCKSTVARTEAELAEQLQMALAQQEGPWLIEAVFDRGSASL